MTWLTFFLTFPCPILQPGWERTRRNIEILWLWESFFFLRTYNTTTGASIAKTFHKSRIQYDPLCVCTRIIFAIGRELVDTVISDADLSLDDGSFVVSFSEPLGTHSRMHWSKSDKQSCGMSEVVGGKGEVVDYSLKIDQYAIPFAKNVRVVN